jgi:hypothetical protein
LFCLIKRPLYSVKSVFKATPEHWHASCIIVLHFNMPTNNIAAETFGFIQLIFTLLFLGTLAAGVYLLRNSERLFGSDPNTPSENSSGRAYGKMQAFVVWAHVAALTGAFAFLIH